MTGIVKQPFQEGRVFQRFGGSLLPATLGETLRATVADPTLRLTQLLWTQIRIRQETGATIRITGRGPRAAKRIVDPNPELSPLVSPEELNEEFGHTGAHFTEPTRRRVAEIIAEQKLEEKIRQDVLRRGPDGFLAGTARFGAAFLGSVIDPLSIGASLIPFVGPARYAGLVARLGTTGARASKGAIEGALGSALVEIATVPLARQQQLDYEASDALLNVAFGGVLKGGLHATGGALGDLLARSRPEAREAALRAAVAQMAQGQRVDVDAIIARERAALARAVAEVERRPLGPEDDPLVAIRPSKLEEILVERGPVFERDGEIVFRGRALKRLFGTRQGFGLVKIVWRHGSKSAKPEANRLSLEDITAFPEVVRNFEPSRVDGEPGKVGFKREFRVERSGRTIVYSISRLARRKPGEAKSQAKEAERLVTIFVESELPKGARFSQRRTGAAPGSPSTGLNRIQDTAPEALASPGVGREPSPAPNNIAPNREKINEAGRREGLSERDATADFEAARDAKALLGRLPADADATSAKAEADLAEARLRALRDEDGSDVSDGESRRADDPASDAAPDPRPSSKDETDTPVKGRREDGDEPPAF